MDPELERRFAKTDKTLEEHVANSYTYIDELRASHVEHAARMLVLEADLLELKEMNRELKEMNRGIKETNQELMERQTKLDNGLLRLIEIQIQTAILASMNGRLSDHDKRLSNGGF